MNARVFTPLLYLFSTPVNILVGISGALGNERKPISICKNVFWENTEGYLRNSAWETF